MSTERDKESTAVKDIEQIILEKDPPIIVGGGGSAYVWIRRSLATEVEDPTTLPNNIPHPMEKGEFIVYLVDVNVVGSAVFKGEGTATVIFDGLHPGKHVTVFYP